MRILKDARIDVIQPGVEAVSTSLLTRMNKGIKGFQNIAMMRYARACGITINWSLLYAFPGDHIEDYQETLRVLPLLYHLSPPLGMDRLDFERFSPYCLEPAKYNLRNMRPLKGYYDLLPEHIDPATIAYNFTCEYDCSAFDYPDIMQSLKDAVYVSANLETDGYPLLHITQLAADRYQLTDSRGLANTKASQVINKAQASAALVSMPLKQLTHSKELYEWAMANKLALEMDEMYVALVTAPPELLAEFEKHKKASPLADIKPVPMSLERRVA
jgi:hypothetical protein